MLQCKEPTMNFPLLIYVRNFNIILSRALRQENIYCNNCTRIINKNKQTYVKPGTWFGRFNNLHSGTRQKIMQ